MSSYHRLSQIQGYQIQALYGMNTAHAVIAAQVGCHRDTIKRELKRGCSSNGSCSAEYAQADCQQRTSRSRNARQVSDQIVLQVRQYGIGVGATSAMGSSMDIVVKFPNRPSIKLDTLVHSD